MVVIFINDPYDSPKKVIDGQCTISSFVVNNLEGMFNGHDFFIN